MMKLIRASILMALVTVLFAGEAAAQTTIRMNANQRLDKGQTIEVAGQGYLIMQPDGNLVLYDAANQPKWATGTSGKAATHVIMQPDGNLVIYNKKNPRWASDTQNVGAGGYFEIDLTTWTGRIYRADGTVARVLFGQAQSVQVNVPVIPPPTPTPVSVHVNVPVIQPPPPTSPPVQLNMPAVTLAPPTPTPQMVQMIEGPTTVISGTLAPVTMPAGV